MLLRVSGEQRQAKLARACLQPAASLCCLACCGAPQHHMIAGGKPRCHMCHMSEGQGLSPISYRLYVHLTAAVALVCVLCSLLQASMQRSELGLPDALIAGVPADLQQQLQPHS
jgi:hypothetical protein